MFITNIATSAHKQDFAITYKSSSFIVKLTHRSNSWSVKARPATQDLSELIVRNNTIAFSSNAPNLYGEKIKVLNNVYGQGEGMTTQHTLAMRLLLPEIFSRILSKIRRSCRSCARDKLIIGRCCDDERLSRFVLAKMSKVGSALVNVGVTRIRTEGDVVLQTKRSEKSMQQNKDQTTNKPTY